MGVTEVLQAVVKVLAIGGKWRFAGAKAAQHSECEVEQRQNQYGKWQDQRNECREKVILGGDGRVDLAGDG